MPQEEILKLIGNISPHAMDYVYNSFENNNVEILYFLFTEQNKGVFIKVDSDDSCIFYASFLNEDNIEEVLEIIDIKLNETIPIPNSKELCFNIYGNNLKIIDSARKSGFKLDMDGYHLEYIGKKPSHLFEHNLIDKGFDSSMLEEFVDLFDSSYFQLNIDNGWKTDGHAANKEQFHQKLNNMIKCRQVRSFWLNNELVGAYIFDKDYITDIVVKPIFQNKGYGSYILKKCIIDMSMSESIKNIRLRVAKSNVGAKKLYERNDFVEIACFAEHTFEQV